MVTNDLERQANRNRLSFWQRVAFGTVSALGLTACATPGTSADRVDASESQTTVTIGCPEGTQLQSDTKPQLITTKFGVSPTGNTVYINHCVAPDGTLFYPTSMDVTDGSAEGVQLFKNEVSESFDVIVRDGRPAEDVEVIAA